MLIVDSLIVSGVRFVLDKIAEAVETELYDETHLREELIAAQMKLELGEIDEKEIEAIEAQVFAGLREIAEHKRGTAPAPAAGENQKFAIESVSADFDHRDVED